MLELNSQQASTDIRADKSIAPSGEKTIYPKTVDTLLNHSFLWRASHHSASDQPVVSTGFRQLDQQLACGGWPLGQFIECLLSDDQIDQAGQSTAMLQGLLYIFLPAIRALASHESQNQAPVLLINPPCQPHLPGWFEQADKQLWVLQAKNIEEQLWATEQALTSNACSVVMSWLPGARQAVSALRKLQLAARRSQSLFVGVRGIAHQRIASPARLRISLQAIGAAGVTHIEKPNRRASSSSRHYTQLAVHIVKQAGRWGGQTVPVSWHSQLQHPMLPATQWPVHYPSQSVATGNDTYISGKKQRLYANPSHTGKYS